MDVTVFNLEVAGNHNYFVGQCCALVHNKGGDTSDGPEYYATGYAVTYGADCLWKNMNVFCGVPTWKDR